MTKTHNNNNNSNKTEIKRDGNFATTTTTNGKNDHSHHHQHHHPHHYHHNDNSKQKSKFGYYSKFKIAIISVSILVITLVGTYLIQHYSTIISVHVPDDTQQPSQASQQQQISTSSPVEQHVDNVESSVNRIKKQTKKTKSKIENEMSAVNAAEMVQFLDRVLDAHLDDFATIEQRSESTIRLRDLLKFNALHIAPRIASIVKMDSFRFVKFNLKRPCTLWPDIFSCTKIGCNIKFCDRSELPDSYLELDENQSSPNIGKDIGTAEDATALASCPTDSPKTLSQLDSTLSKSSVDSLNVLFQCSPDDDEDSEYYDLLRNPERYTGYDGGQIWKAIYEENCFANELGTRRTNLFSSLSQRCYEERVFYRSISGLHSSITTHLTSIHHKFSNQFGPNPADYFKRFYGNSNYLKNLFFIYLLELRALYKIQPYLVDRLKWKTDANKHEIRDAITDLLRTEKRFKWHFNENVLFTNTDTRPLAEQLAAHFHNITFNIMDCVSCDKCRLWGKVQTNGLGTAFKILLTRDIDRLRLSHHEITCLLNALGRLSFSIAQIEPFRELFAAESAQQSQPHSSIGIGAQKPISDDKGSFLNYI